MTNIRNVRLHWIVFFSFTAFCIVGCAAAPKKKPFYTLVNESSVAIIPFVNFSEKLIQKTGFSASKKPTEPAQAEDILTDSLVMQLRQKGVDNVLVLPKLSKDEVQTFSIKTVEKHLLEDTRLVIISRILRFNERQGHKYASAMPASVALDIRIIETGSGRILHLYEFSETQEALLDNILNLKKFLGRKGQWVKAIDLALYGVTLGVKEMTE